MGSGYCQAPEWRIDKKAKYKVVRLDNNLDCKPDIIWNLKIHPLPFKDESFDEVHAYDVLEHLAPQGDYEFFFAEFAEYWRILKKDGLFICSVPKRESVWAIGDPSHSRIIVEENFNYLSQKFYKMAVDDKKTKCSDFRYIWKHNFELIAKEPNINPDIIYFFLKKK